MSYNNDYPKERWDDLMSYIDKILKNNKDMSNKQEFKWTDELVNDFVGKCILAVKENEEEPTIEQFKESKNNKS